MARPRFRFSPPTLALDEGLRWLVRRAFGPPGSPPQPLADPAAALAIARETRLLARIASRTPAGALEAELREGAPAAREARMQLLARAAMVRQTLDVVSEVATSPWCLLKGPALVLSGTSRADARPSSDLDVLVPRGAAPPLERALLARGFRRSGVAYEHQSAALVAAPLVPIEVHHIVLGVRLDGRHSADLDALEREGLVETLEGHPGGLLPTQAVLFAHALLHGLAQHGLNPGAYPALLLLADLADLGARAPLAELRRRAAAWIARDLTDAEVDAATALSGALARGEIPGGDGERLLSHLLAGFRDPDYALSLKLRGWRRGVTEHAAPVALVLDVAAALDPPSGAGGLGRIVARSADLARRVKRSRDASRKKRP